MLKNLGRALLEFKENGYFRDIWKEGIIPKDYKIYFLFIVRVINKEENSFRLYEYKFDDIKKLNSIKLVKNKQYNVKFS